jgi:hypothetical protein
MPIYISNPPPDNHAVSMRNFQEASIEITAETSFKVLIGMTGGLLLKVLNLFDISMRSSVSKNVVEKFGRNSTRSLPKHHNR